MSLNESQMCTLLTTRDINTLGSFAGSLLESLPEEFRIKAIRDINRLEVHLQTFFNQIEANDVLNLSRMLMCTERIRKNQSGMALKPILGVHAPRPKPFPVIIEEYLKSLPSQYRLLAMCKIKDTVKHYQEEAKYLKSLSK